MTTADRVQVHFTDVIDARFPEGGPYDDEHTRHAGQCLTRLVRYLNHATYSDQAATSPATVADVISSVEQALRGLDQTLTQAAVRLSTLANQPGAYLDGLAATRQPDPPAVALATSELIGEAMAHIAGAAQLIKFAHSNASRIGLAAAADDASRGDTA